MPADPQHPRGHHDLLCRDDARQGAQLACSAAGTRRNSSLAMAPYAQIRLRSGEVRRVLHVECRATVGEVGNEENILRKIGKAGAQRWREFARPFAALP